MDRNVDLNLFAVFDALMAERSVTLAGQRLGRTQSAVSNALKRLRATFRDPLFVRTAGGLVPTPRAEEIALKSVAILGLAEEALRSGAGHDPQRARGRFAIGAPDRLSLPVFLPLIRQLRNDAPGISIDLRTTDRDYAVEQVVTGKIDLALGWFDDVPPVLGTSWAMSETLVCLCDRGHPLVAEGGPDLDRLTAFPHVVVTSGGDRTAAFDAILARSGRSRRAAASLANFALVPGLLAESELIGVFTRRVATYLARRHGLATLEIASGAFRIDHQMIWHRRFEADPGHRWLRERIASICQNPADPH